MRGEKDKKNLWIKILSVVIILLVLFIVIMFIVRPAINNYVIKKQIQAQEYVIASILNQIQQTGYVQLPVGNQTLVLVPYQPEQTVQ